MMTSLRKNYLVGTPTKYSHVEESLHTKEPMDINGRQFEIAEYGACPIVEEWHSQMKVKKRLRKKYVGGEFPKKRVKFVATPYPTLSSKIPTATKELESKEKPGKEEESKQ